MRRKDITDKEKQKVQAASTPNKYLLQSSTCALFLALTLGSCQLVKKISHQCQSINGDGQQLENGMHESELKCAELQGFVFAP